MEYKMKKGGWKNLFVQFCYLEEYISNAEERNLLTRDLFKLCLDWGGTVKRATANSETVCRNGDNGKGRRQRRAVAKDDDKERRQQ